MEPTEATKVKENEVYTISFFKRKTVLVNNVIATSVLAVHNIVFTEFIILTEQSINFVLVN